MTKIKISVWLESPDGDRMEKNFDVETDKVTDIDIAYEAESLIPQLVFWDWERIEDIEEEKPSKPDDIPRWSWK